MAHFLSSQTRMQRFILLVFFALILSSLYAFAIPNQMTIQGRLLNASGSALEGPYNATFKIYAQHSGGSALYEYQTNITSDSNGAYEKILPSINLNFSDQYFLGITIANDSEATPRINLTSQAYAFRSNITESINPQNAYSAESLALTNNLSLGQRISFGLGQLIEAATSGLVQISPSLRVAGNFTVASGLFFDSTAGRLGIGNLNPNSTLDVSGNANISGMLSASAVNVSGTIQAARFVGDGSGLSGVSTSSFTRENVSEYLGGSDQNASIIRASNLTLYNRSISLDNYNRSVSLDSYNRSISLDPYAKTAQLSFLSNGSTAILLSLNVSSINGSDISSFNRSISLDLYNKSISLDNYNKSISLDLYNRSVSLDSYAKLTALSFLANGSNAILVTLNVSSINGTDIALFNKSISLDAYNRSISLDAYNRSVSLDNYNRSVSLDSYAKSSDVLLQIDNVTIIRAGNLTTIVRTSDAYTQSNFTSNYASRLAEQYSAQNLSDDIQNSTNITLTYENGRLIARFNMTCAQITGSQELCDGDDEAGGGSSATDENYATNITAYFGDTSINSSLIRVGNSTFFAIFSRSSDAFSLVNLTGFFGDANINTSIVRASNLTLYNRSISLDSYNKSISLDSYNRSISLDTYNRSVSLTGYLTLENNASAAQFNASATAIFTRDEAKNVGIGTQTPVKRLTVNGTLNALTFDPSASTPTINTTGNNLTLASATGSVIIKLG